MSGTTTKNSPASTATTKQEIRSRLRETLKQVKRLMKAGVGSSTDPYRLLLKKGEFFVSVAAAKNDAVIHAYVRRYRPKPKEWSSPRKVDSVLAVGLVMHPLVLSWGDVPQR